MRSEVAAQETAISNQEVAMSKTIETPKPRLIRVGGAKARTNAPGGKLVPEEDITVKFN